MVSQYYGTTVVYAVHLRPKHRYVAHDYVVLQVWNEDESLLWKAREMKGHDERHSICEGWGLAENFIHEDFWTVTLYPSGWGKLDRSVSNWGMNGFVVMQQKKQTEQDVYSTGT
jgi:hypothetical protein